MNDGEWIGVDLDGTLAVYDGWRADGGVGEPIPLMVERVRRWLRDGLDVRIMTARVSGGQADEQIPIIEDWCFRVFGRVLPITCCKDYQMVELWDDRAIQVEKNTGLRVDGMEEPTFEPGDISSVM